MKTKNHKREKSEKAKAITREELDKKIAEFKERGGKIKKEKAMAGEYYFRDHATNFLMNKENYFETTIQPKVKIY